MDKEKIKREVGANILHHRINRLQWSRKKLSTYSEIPESEIFRIETGKKDFTICTAKKLADGMELTVSELFDFTIDNKKF